MIACPFCGEPMLPMASGEGVVCPSHCDVLRRECCGDKPCHNEAIGLTCAGLTREAQTRIDGLDRSK